jgi:hypothetical protein
MSQIPLPPVGVPPEPPSASTTAAPAKKKRFATIRKVFRGIGWLGSSPVHWMGIGSIRQGGAFITDLTERAQARPARDPRFKTAAEGGFDLQATAFSMGMSVSELERHLATRRRQTALIAYGLGSLGIAFLALWLLKVLSAPFLGARFILAIDFLPLCLLFVLLAFQQALLNYQIRIRRTAGWLDYLTTEKRFWPRA